jgi:hypothetical protein
VLANRYELKKNLGKFIGRCFSGWGRGRQPDILRQTEVPLVNASRCQEQLRKTKLGSNFTLDPQLFICAGGEKGNDTCSRDGGSSLFCEVSGQQYLVGLAAWDFGEYQNRVKIELNPIAFQNVDRKMFQLFLSISTTM